jgi:hypothetical protein
LSNNNIFRLSCLDKKLVDSWNCLLISPRRTMKNTRKISSKPSCQSKIWSKITLLHSSLVILTARMWSLLAILSLVKRTTMTSSVCVIYWTTVAHFKTEAASYNCLNFSINLMKATIKYFKVWKRISGSRMVRRFFNLAAWFSSNITAFWDNLFQKRIRFYADVITKLI